MDKQRVNKIISTKTCPHALIFEKMPFHASFAYEFLEKPSSRLFSPYRLFINILINDDHISGLNNF